MRNDFIPGRFAEDQDVFLTSPADLKTMNAAWKTKHIRNDPARNLKASKLCLQSLRIRSADGSGV